MEKPRKYGNPPFTVAVIHGGPGAPGEMAPVARKLSSITGVLEPLQTKAILEGQVEELRDILEEHGDLPVNLIGFSWGAMLSFIFTAFHPRFVKKLVLVGSGPYEEKYAINIASTRINRLGKEDLEKLLFLEEVLNNSSVKYRNEIFCNIGKLISKADTYNLLPMKKK